MKRILTTSLALALAAGLGACVDLNEDLVSNLSNEYLATQDGLNAAPGSVYARLRGYYGREQFMALTDMGTDLITNGDQVSSGAQAWFYFADYNAQLNSLDDRIRNAWNNFYILIATANAILDKGPNTPVGGALTQAVKDSRLGETHFLRALAYFELVRMFGPVTLNLEGAAGISTEASRAPEDSVYMAIVSDLERAIELLPVNQPEFGRARKGAAQHLLAKVHLTRAYRPWNTTNRNADFQRALELSQAVINSGAFTLAPVYQDLWCGQLPDSVNLRTKDPLRQSYCNVASGSGFNKQNPEVIFSVQYTYSPAQYLAGWCGNAGNVCANFLHLVYLTRYDNDSNIGAGLPRDLNNGRPFRRNRSTNYAFTLFDQTRWAGTPGQSDIMDTRFDGTFQTLWFASGASAGGNKNNGFWNDVCPNCSSGDPIAVGDTALWMPGYAVTDAFRRSKRFAIFVPCPTDPLQDCGKDTKAQRHYGWEVGPSIKKHMDNGRTGGVADEAGGKDVILMRLGETHLIAAEAAVGMGNNAEAAAQINVLRQRAAAPAYRNDARMLVTAAQMSLDFIMDERARELMGEGHRWADLVRPGADYFVQRVRMANPDARANVAVKHALRPIPQEQINGVTGRPYPQNAGY